MYRIRLLGAGLMLALSWTGEALAADSDIGIDQIRAPELDGLRAISARFQPQDNNLFQQPFSRSVPAGRHRLVLEYGDNENLTGDHKIVAQIKPANTASRAEAVLPQGQLNPSYPDAVFALNPHYYHNPIKFVHGSSVFYRWCLQARDRNRCGDVHQFSMPHPLVIGIMGDSYGAGEGAPHNNSTVQDSVRWVDRDSHRSRNSGHYRAVLKFKQKYPQLWIESKHVAISGATLNTDRESGLKSGFLTEAVGDTELKVYGTWVTVIAGAAPVAVPIPIPTRSHVHVESQFRQIGEWLANSGYDRMHVLLISAGGNDAGFGNVIRDAILGTLSFAYPDTLRAFRGNLSVLRDFARQEFKPALNELVPSEQPSPPPQNIIWTTYPNMTLDQDNRRSGVIADASLNPSLMLMDQAVGADDMRNAEHLLVNELNPAVRQICEQILDQCVIAEVENAAAGHGINATPEKRWFNTFQDAQDDVQGSVDGAVHPNKAGYALYIEPVIHQLEALYRPGRGSEYKRMMKQRAREKMKNKVAGKAFETRMTKLAIARKAQPAQPRISRDAAGLIRNRKSAAKQQVAFAARKRESNAKRSARKFRVTDYKKALVRNGKLRLVLPDEKRVAQIRATLSNAGKTDDLKKFDQMMESLNKTEGRINAQLLQSGRGKNTQRQNSRGLAR